MAISVDWAAKIINVPQADLTPLGGSVYELDLDAFRLALKALEAGAEGMAELDTHSHNTLVTVAGLTLARVVEIINGYTVTFEDGQYGVNAVGANSNLADVLVRNQVSVNTANSAGLIVTAGGVTPLTQQEIRDAMKLAPTAGAAAAGSVDLVLTEIYDLLGLDPTKPLTVSATERAAGGDITQTISEAAGTVTVTRQ